VLINNACQDRVPYRPDRIIVSAFAPARLKRLHQVFVGQVFQQHGKSFQIREIFDFFP
jgi:hypothetical protein